MSRTNFDSSYLTLVKQQRTLYGFKNSLKDAQVSNPTVLLRTQPNTQLSAVQTDAAIGASLCPPCNSNGSELNLRTFNPSGGGYADQG